MDREERDPGVLYEKLDLEADRHCLRDAGLVSLYQLGGSHQQASVHGQSRDPE